MKLKNKKTGEIRELPDGFFCGDNLKKICEEWEDYEEPKGCWIINIFGIVEYTHFRNEAEAELLKEIGNRFETEEEAERAREKIDAWKRLKDKGFEFRWIDMQTGQIKYSFFLKEGQKITRKDEDDLLLLFGGEE